MFWSLDLADNKGAMAEWDGEQDGLKNLHVGAVRGLWPRGKGPKRDLDRVDGEWKVKGDEQRCTKGPDGGETETVEARAGRREGSVVLLSHLWASV